MGEGKEDAYKCAVEHCIQEGILADYLEKKGSEVVNMLIAEYDYDMDIEVQREEAFEEGKARGRAEDILEILSELGEVPEELRKKIEREEDLERLTRWLKQAAKAESIETFADQMS